MTRSHARRQRRRAKLGRLDYLIHELITRDGDNCTVCCRRLTDRELTYYGIRFGKLFITGTCCAAKLEDIVAGGFYIAKYDREAS